MKIELLFCGKPVRSFSELMKCYPNDEFDSITRSTVPSLLYWAEGSKRVEDLANNLGLELPSSCKLDFEYKVHPPKGKGFPSCTDVMISWKDVAVGIEAKYTETPYDSVDDWIIKGTDKNNRRLVLEGWVDLIRERSGFPICIDSVYSVPYQMVHRLASVCSRQEKNLVLMYQIFNPNEKMNRYYENSLKKIKSALGETEHIRLVLSVVVLETKLFEEI